MDWKAIRKEYETTSITMVELAEKHDVKPSTLRSRKNREKWQQGDSNATEDVATQCNDVATEKKVIKELNSNSELNERQKLFCLHYLKSFNATQSYIKAYNVDYTTAMVNGSRLLSNAKVKKELDRLKSEQRSAIYVEAEDILKELAKQAFTDINDVLEFGTEDVPYTDEESGEEKIYKRSYVRFKNDVDGTLIQEVKQGRDGVSLKLYDKQKAMLELLKRMEDSGVGSESITIVDAWSGSDV